MIGLFHISVDSTNCSGSERAAQPHKNDGPYRTCRIAQPGLKTRAAKCILVPLALLFLVFGPALNRTLDAQTVPVGDLREEQLRIQQLLNDSLSTSFVNRPVWNRVYDIYMDAAEGRPGWWNRKIAPPEFELGRGFTLGFYEPVTQTTTNSTLPFGENNAAAWYGKGINTEFTGGFYLAGEYVTLTFRPQLVYQQNNEFVAPRFVPRNDDGELSYVAEAIYDRIDRPFRFGPDPFWTNDRGHSSLRFHYNAIEAGFSTEPLWWGGAVQYPLMMSNNAPGVPHIFIGTRSPLVVPYAGSFEFRWMGGWPEDSEWFEPDVIDRSNPDPYDLSNPGGTGTFGQIAPAMSTYDAAGSANQNSAEPSNPTNQEQQTRFMNAVNIAFSPEWIPHLHVGFTRAFHFYIDESGLSGEDLFVIFDPFLEKNLEAVRGTAEERKPRNHLSTLYARWVWPEQHMEIYGEYYRESRNWDWRDLFTQIRHDSGYSIGFQNLVPLPSVDIIEFLGFNFEYTQMTPGRIDELRDQSYFYTHEVIRQGHTNRGQVLGAAIGPGSNSIYLGMDAYTENSRFGLFIQRWVDNEHFHYEYNQLHGPRWAGDKWRHPVRINLGSRFLYQAGPIFLTGHIKWTKAYNYGRFGYGTYGIDWEDRVMDDMSNLQLQFSVRYVF